jgi:hypothetical protein
MNNTRRLRPSIWHHNRLSPRTLHTRLAPYYFLEPFVPPLQIDIKYMSDAQTKHRDVLLELV